MGGCLSLSAILEHGKDSTQLFSRVGTQELQVVQTAQQSYLQHMVYNNCY